MHWREANWTTQLIPNPNYNHMKPIVIGISVQFSLRWYLRAWESPYALYHISQKCLHRCLWSNRLYVYVIVKVQLSSLPCLSLVHLLRQCFDFCERSKELSGMCSLEFSNILFISHEALVMGNVTVCCEEVPRNRQNAKRSGDCVQRWTCSFCILVRSWASAALVKFWSRAMCLSPR